MKNLKLYDCICILFVLIISSAGCKTIQSHITSSDRKEQSSYMFTISIELQDNGSAMNELMDKIEKIFCPFNARVIDSNAFFDTMKEVQVITGVIPEMKINAASSELFKIVGVMKVNVYKN